LGQHLKKGRILCSTIITPFRKSSCGKNTGTFLGLLIEIFSFKFFHLNFFIFIFFNLFSFRKKKEKIKMDIRVVVAIGNKFAIVLFHDRITAETPNNVFFFLKDFGTTYSVNHH